MHSHLKQSYPLSLMLSPSMNQHYRDSASELSSLILTQRQCCDLELLLNGGFAPLQGFMNQADYDAVLTDIHLSQGRLWPIPITLDVDHHFAAQVKRGQEIALRDAEGLLLAILQIEDQWIIDKPREAEAVFGSTDDHHPGVAYLYRHVKEVYLGGTLLGLALPQHYDFTSRRHTPTELQTIFAERGWKKIVAFQTRNPMHRAHQELTLRAAEQTGAHLLIHPVVGMTKPGDIEYYTRVRCYEHVLKTYPPESALLSLLPLAMRMGGPREAIWHALIRKNYGCTHFIVGRDHAGPGRNRVGDYFYDPYAAQQLALQYQKEIGLEIVPFQEMVFSQKQSRYFPIDQFPKEDTPSVISGTELRERLQKREAIPEWFSYPVVIEELRKVHPLRHQQGFTVFFTGLPSAGKSTLAQALSIKLREMTERPITLLDGDVIRTHLSQGLGFSREDRALNVMRVGFVAREITKHHGIVICALVSPFSQERDHVRQMITEVGGFIEVYVATPLAVCEKRDRKGLYKKARAGLVKQFTGVSDPYEPPMAPEISLDTTHGDPQEMVEVVVKQIKLLGYLS